jgi:hypothetical protein
MLKSLLSAAVITLGTVGLAMAQDRIRISSDWGEVTADLAGNEAAKSLARMLPLTIEMSRKRQAICHPHCRSWRGNVTSLLARSASGVPIISLSTIAAVACRFPALSCSGKPQVMSRFLTAPVPSPSESKVQTERCSARRIAAGREPVARVDAPAQSGSLSLPRVRAIILLRI